MRTKEQLRDIWPEWNGVDANGCWIWARAMMEGYGWLGAVALHPDRPMRAHTAAYLLFVGPVPEGRELHHLCEVKACTNPDHLMPVTDAEHIRLHVPEFCPRGHEPNWRITPSGSRYCRPCDMERGRRRRNSPLAVAA